MAEGLARARFGSDVRVQSAGSQPSGVSPLAIQVMEEIGIYISDHRSKGVDAIKVATIDIVVTLCADEVCPAILKSVQQIHWAIPDPAVATDSESQRLERFRGARDEIAARLGDLENRMFTHNEPSVPVTR